MTILRGDKVVLVKAFGKLNQIGNTFEVADFVDTKVIIRDSIKKIAVGAIFVTDFEEHFVKVDDIKNEWTDWNRMVDPFGNTVAMYRTNYKKVQVRIYNNSDKSPKCFKGEACCNKKYDEFTLGFGINLAYERAYQKALINRIADLESVSSDLKDNIVEIQTEIMNSRNTVKKMYSYFDKKDSK